MNTILLLLFGIAILLCATLWFRQSDTINPSNEERQKASQGNKISQNVIETKNSDVIEYEEQEQSIPINRHIYMLVIASRGGIYDFLLKEYWPRIVDNIRQHFTKDISVYFLFGNDAKVDDLNLPLIIDPNHNETFIPGILQKSVYGIEQVLSKMTTNDILLRTNLSSFFLFDRLIAAVKRMPTRNFYAGAVDYTSDERYLEAFRTRHTHCANNAFVNGACIFFSKDVCQYIVSNKLNIDYLIIDDVAFRCVLCGITPPTNIKRRYIPILSTKTSQELQDHCNKILNDKQVFHIRNVWNDSNELLAAWHSFVLEKLLKQ